MEIVLEILPWFGFGIGIAVAKYYFVFIGRPTFFKPQLFWNPMGHVGCFALMGLGIWSAVSLPWWGTVLLVVVVPELRVLLGIVQLRKEVSQGRVGPMRQHSTTEEWVVDWLKGDRSGSSLQSLGLLDRSNGKRISKAQLNNPNEIVKILLAKGGLAVELQDFEILEIKISRLAFEQKKILQDLEEIAFRGLMLFGISGHEFFSGDLISQRYGVSLEENYRSASPTFMRLATSYWTFKLADDHPDYRPSKVSGHRIFANVDLTMSSVFFPTQGKEYIGPDQREEMQRKILQEFCPGIDILDFIKGNPILIRDRLLEQR